MDLRPYRHRDLPSLRTRFRQPYGLIFGGKLRAIIFGMFLVSRHKSRLPTSHTSISPIHFYCDNKSLVRRVNEFLRSLDGSFRRGLIPNFGNVFLTACVLRQLPPRMIKLQHVKGHQDSTAPAHQLSWPAQLNVIADQLASQYSTTPAATPFLLRRKSIFATQSKTLLLKGVTTYCAWCTSTSRTKHGYADNTHGKLTHYLTSTSRASISLSRAFPLICADSLQNGSITASPFAVASIGMTL